MSTNQNLRQHMRELIDRIKAADVAYYRDDNPTMTDREYDLLVDELKELETTTGLILSGSPTQTVPGEILKELMPVRHTKPMLSADKTKSVDEMLRFANGRPVVLSWKLDGLTIVLRYEGGEFKQAITRGREGIIGEDVTHTVRTFMNVPMCIPCADKFEVRGEGVISWAHFEKINLSLSEPYSHPRNLAAGSVRMLDLQQQGEDIACMDDFWVRYTEPALLNECGFFVYFLNTQGPEEACIFLQDNRCRIHTVNPRACRIYPLVVDPKENGRYEYLVSYERKQHFKGPKVHVKTWMKKRFDEEGRAFLTADLGSAKELARLLRQIPDERKKKALMCFHWAKYGNLDTSKPFLPQYERNLKVLHEYLKELTE